MSLLRLAGRLSCRADPQIISKTLFSRAMTSAADVETKLRDKLGAQEVVSPTLTSCAPSCNSSGPARNAITLFQAFLIILIHLRADSHGYIWRVATPLLLPLNVLVHALHILKYLLSICTL